TENGCCRQVLYPIQIDLRSNASSVINSSTGHLNAKNRLIQFCRKLLRDVPTTKRG
uniref:Ovule protein n=1 Tax=Mesocestoides corti TaxID=53468 RepID=A0A5K3FTZ2_MESCO